MRNDGNPFRNQGCDLCRDNPIFRLLQNNAYVLEDRPVPGRPAVLACVNILNVIENLTTNPPPWLCGIRSPKTKSGQAGGVNCYLNERFKDQLFRKAYKNYTITPLVCMSVNARTIRLFLKKMVFSKTLENRITADPKLKFPFEWASRYVPRARRDACMPIWKR
ncbi:hypothetical protein HDF14_002987 [Edaphobacter lichenicola]|uniref:Uncharacterized protein n=1 Tax=Tunturiibacter gelidiferens TaxID=3069689 RepID=A0A9X0QFN1_9BACT|nr:hypothetical protein [Edaphobacter lichenicola]